ncbi:MAG: tRNA lysidine(34) synthetase TilS [Bacteroidetes bacterium]|nr:tRNA lysidine(34) synthetase TilS [Bacteroidota bacterium]
MKESPNHIVQSNIKDETMFPPGTPLLVACSGGVDSMVAVDILRSLNYPVGLAHCNFKLRGNDADGDQDFVRSYAMDNGIPFFTIDFDTEQYAGTHKMSIQLAARVLRYEWLEQMRLENGFHFIVTAHHMNDNAETVLNNLIRNTGLRGLHGILPKRDKVVRPLLCLSRTTIEGYASERSISFREDSSNASLKYTRNFIRHKIVPEIQSVNPEAVSAIHAMAARTHEAEILMEERMTQIRKRILVHRYDAVEIKFGYVLQHASGKTILYEILRDDGFNGDQVLEIFNNLKGRAGIEFLSTTHKVIKDRRSLFVIPLDSKRDWICKWDSIPKEIIFNNFKIQIRKVPIAKCNMKRSSNYAYFDLDKLKMPLTMRYRKDGDYFYPYGLTKRNSDKPGKKKLSKYFKDEKLSVYEKEVTPVLFSGEQLIWLVGQRIDDRVKVDEDTKTVLKCKILAS